MGTRDDNISTKNRPLKVKLDMKSKRSEIMKNAKKLKNLDIKNPLKKVFLKPDVHSKIRKEEAVVQSIQG